MYKPEMRLRSSWFGQGWLVGFSLLAAACGSEDSNCKVNADCASNACGTDGICAPIPTNDAGGDAQSSSDATSVQGCQPNHDGTISGDEIVVGFGAVANFRTASDVSVDTVGTGLNETSRSWDLSGMFDGDKDVAYAATPIEGFWFAKDFPGATFVAPLSSSTGGFGSNDLVNIFEVSPDGLLLHGAASVEDGVTRTKLTYDPPVPFLAFPLTVGGKWQSSHTVTGVMSGVLTLFSDAFTTEVDSQGEMTTPYGKFPVLRLHTKLTRTVGLLPTVQQSYVFVSECFGVVAAITSQANELSDEFKTASEIRRLAP